MIKSGNNSEMWSQITKTLNKNWNKSNFENIPGAPERPLEKSMYHISGRHFRSVLQPTHKLSAVLLISCKLARNDPKVISDANFQLVVKSDYIQNNCKEFRKFQVILSLDLVFSCEFAVLGILFLYLRISVLVTYVL